MKTNTTGQVGRKLPACAFSAGDDGCGPVAVVGRTAGGYGGMHAYAGGFLTGHVGHAASMMSAAQLRRLAVALVQAADAIDASGLPSLQELRARQTA
jgi:hypothetical protein